MNESKVGEQQIACALVQVESEAAAQDPTDVAS